MKVRLVESKYGLGEREVSVFKTEVPDDVAAFAMLLIEKWGLVAALPDGEDSSGRAKLRLPTSEELVARAFEIAEAAFGHAAMRGRMVPLPDLNEINAEYDEEREEEAARKAKVRAARKAMEAATAEQPRPDGSSGNGCRFPPRNGAARTPPPRARFDTGEVVQEMKR